MGMGFRTHYFNSDVKNADIFLQAYSTTRRAIAMQVIKMVKQITIMEHGGKGCLWDLRLAVMGFIGRVRARCFSYCC